MPDSLSVHTRRPKILHLSGDFPDPTNSDKTSVIARLIKLVEDRYENQVVSLNRQNPSLLQVVDLLNGSLSPVPMRSIAAFENGIALDYLAPGKGLLHASMLGRLAEWIARNLVLPGSVPSLVVGHKLTIEGLVAHALATRLGIPYALTIQGNTDEKILLARPDLMGLFSTVFHNAACVFSFAPWALHAVERRLGKRRGATFDLPCPTHQDTIRTPVLGGNPVISVFNLRNHRIKNLAGLAKAMRGAAGGRQPYKVQIYGGGSSEDTDRCAAIIADVPGMELMGPRSQDELGPIMNAATALVMPSRRESFGLVFVEALFAGLPIIYPKGASIDGYFNCLPFAIGVDAHNTDNIAQAVRTAMEQEQGLKGALAHWQQTGGLKRFTRAAIAQTFAHGIDTALTDGGIASTNAGIVQ